MTFKIKQKKLKEKKLSYTYRTGNKFEIIQEGKTPLLKVLKNGKFNNYFSINDVAKKNKKVK